MGTAAVHMSTSTGSSIPITANTNRFIRPGCGAFFSPSVFEFQMRVIWRTAGVWSNLWVRVVSNSNDLTAHFFSRINAADGNQDISIAAATTGIFQDSSNTDTIAAGDLLSIRTAAAHSSVSISGLQISIIQSIFTATAAERVYRLTCGQQTGFNGTGFVSCMAGSPADVAETPLQAHIPGGTMRNGAIRVWIQNRNGASTLVLRVNELDTLLTISIAASTTGYFEDTSNAITVFDRDRANWHFTLGGNSGLFFFNDISVDLVTTAFFGGGSRVGGGIDLRVGSDGLCAHSAWHYQISTANESQVQAEALVTDTWAGIIVVIPTNGQNGSCEWRSRVGGSDSTLTVTVAAFTTGTFESTGSSISVTPTTLINLRRLSNGTNADALNYFTHNFFEAASAPPAGDTLLGGIYRLIPARTQDTLYTGFGPVTTQNNKIPDPLFRLALVGD